MIEPVDDGRTDAPGQQPSLIRLVAHMVRRRRLLIGLPLVAALAALGVSLLLPRLYTVEARFTPEQGRSGMSPQLAGIASQFGVNLGSLGDETESLDFYAELLESHELLRAAVLTSYGFRPQPDADSVRGSLVELLEIEADTEDEAIFEAVEELDDLVTVRADHAAGIISLEVSAPWPELSVLLGERLLDLVNRFNLERRQTRAAAERAFLDERIQEKERELRAAESDLEAFLLQNRRYQDPQLRFQEERLQRMVDLRQQVYVVLAQELEQARLAEVRNTPVITVLDHPRPPAERTSPNYVLNVALGLLLGGLLAVGAILGGDLLRYARRTHPREFADLEAATRDAMGRAGRRFFSDAQDR